ncbi:NAD(P)-dependent alcohol dehydrogenase [Fusibacter sp. 3D3]|uniref:NAD(P)-dependent alcohol dehydrogenase n=1 Tax=Fusibacter sp. 3D3 TaxID=1048380 RepID=UPI000853E68C|nr:NAD(P)-dependent alcohol dehydrogenase [Fusibacter sp. 3D3]GAU78813.1 bifunctional protein zinc-containing alcohol dehydrogenase and quinone oxidoreductase [Fusibacter sp. 3D3]
MKAIVYNKRNHSNPFVLSEVEKPIPNDNEVLVRIYAVSVNAADYRSMKMGAIPKRKIFGADIAGSVEAVGKNITRFVVGDEVLGDISAVGFGGFAEYVAVPETVLVLKPADVSFEIAAAIPMSAVTSLQALRDKGQIQPGQKVLICGAGGGVGTFSVQLAKYFGAEITAVCGTGNLELMRSLGADYVVDYTKAQYTKSGKYYDLILAIHGYQPLAVYRRALAPKGKAVIVGGSLSQIIKALLLGPIMSLGDRKVCSLAAKPNTKDMEFIMKLIIDGKIKPVIDRCYPLSDTADALQYIGKGHARGKVIITVFNGD